MDSYTVDMLINLSLFGLAGLIWVAAGIVRYAELKYFSRDS